MAGSVRGEGAEEGAGEGAGEGAAAVRPLREALRAEAGALAAAAAGVAAVAVAAVASRQRSVRATGDSAALPGAGRPAAGGGRRSRSPDSTVLSLIGGSAGRAEGLGGDTAAASGVVRRCANGLAAMRGWPHCATAAGCCAAIARRRYSDALANWPRAR